MANLKDDLDQYLLLQSEQKKTYKIDMKMPSIKVPEIKNLFGKSQPPEANGWLQDTKDSCCPKLSRLQRIFGFLICLGLGIFCMTLSTFYIPVLILKARKFALLYSLGSVFFILSFCFLTGFMLFFRQAFSKSRLAVSGTYAGSLMATLYFALFLQSTILTIIAAGVQVAALCLMVIGEVPGGASGIRFFTQMFRRSVSNTLPV